MSSGATWPSPRRRTHVTDYLVRVVSTLPEAELEKLPFIKLKGEDNVKTKVVERWTEFLSAKTADDPVFGPWRDLAKLPVEQFSSKPRRSSPSGMLLRQAWNRAHT